MPSTSKKQERFMAAAAKSKDFADRAGINQSVAKEFHEADKRRDHCKCGFAKMTKGRGGL
jgi:hypothetical protein